MVCGRDGGKIPRRYACVQILRQAATVGEFARIPSVECGIAWILANSATYQRKLPDLALFSEPWGPNRYLSNGSIPRT